MNYRHTTAVNQVVGFGVKSLDLSSLLQLTNRVPHNISTSLRSYSEKGRNFNVTGGGDTWDTWRYRPLSRIHRNARVQGVETRLCKTILPGKTV